MKKITIRAEFDPRDFWSINQLLESIAMVVSKDMGKVPDQWNFRVGRMENNASLHVFEGEIWVPDHLTDKIPTDSIYTICNDKPNQSIKPERAILPISIIMAIQHDGQ